MIRRPKTKTSMYRLNVSISPAAREKLGKIAGPFSLGMVVEELIDREDRRRAKRELHHSEEKSC